jgi:HlyD family secretion protein
MPVDSFLQTGNRSVLSYLVRPVQDQLAQAFREE